MKKWHHSILRWFANNSMSNHNINTVENRIDWVRAIPFILINLSCLFAFIVGFSWIALITALIVCYVRVFSLTAFYHRYFSHRAYKTNRFWQFVFAIFGASAVQRGPLWWAAHHRRHHAAADEHEDVHSPLHHGFWWSHMGWFLSKQNYFYDSKNISDLSKYPELVFLDRFDILIPTLLGVCMYAFGAALEYFAPSLGTNGWQMLVWGFSISTIMLFHITVCINSIAHKFGKRSYKTKDNSRNNWLLALLTFGEGWHNNHHYYPASARQGFHFWQIDITYYILLLFKKMGMIWDVKVVPEQVLNSNRIK